MLKKVNILSHFIIINHKKSGLLNVKKWITYLKTLSF
jgi:hypothetical protein